MGFPIKFTRGYERIHFWIMHWELNDPENSQMSQKHNYKQSKQVINYKQSIQSKTLSYVLFCETVKNIALLYIFPINVAIA